MCSPKARGPLYFHFPFTLKNYTNNLRKRLDKEAANKTLLYVIFDNKDNKPIGSVEVRAKKNLPKDNPKNVGQFCCWLNENYWGGGRMREAIRLIAKEYFRLNNVKSFDAQVELTPIVSFLPLLGHLFPQEAYLQRILYSQ